MNCGLHRKRLDMQKIKIGVIGLGWFGQKHCEALAEIAEVELHALCTRTESRLAELAGQFDVEKTYTDYREMLQDPELQAVSVVTMWDQHTAPAVAALQAGKHVFLEKPMASTVADCERIVAAAEQAPGYLMVGHICRFNPRYAAAKEAIHRGSRTDTPAASCDERYLALYCHWPRFSSILSINLGITS